MAAPTTSTLTVDIWSIGGAFVGASAAGMFVTRAPIMDVMTSVSGGAGAAIGWAVGSYLQGNAMIPESLQPLMPMALAGLVPAVASGQYDMMIAVFAGGAWAGAQAISMAKPKQ